MLRKYSNAKRLAQIRAKLAEKYRFFLSIVFIGAPYDHGWRKMLLKEQSLDSD